MIAKTLFGTNIIQVSIFIFKNRSAKIAKPVSFEFGEYSYECEYWVMWLVRKFGNAFYKTISLFSKLFVQIYIYLF